MARDKNIYKSFLQLIYNKDTKKEEMLEKINKNITIGKNEALP